MVPRLKTTNYRNYLSHTITIKVAKGTLDKTAVKTFRLDNLRAISWGCENKSLQSTKHGAARKQVGSTLWELALFPRSLHVYLSSPRAKDQSWPTNQLLDCGVRVWQSRNAACKLTKVKVLFFVSEDYGKSYGPNHWRGIVLVSLF